MKLRFAPAGLAVAAVVLALVTLSGCSPRIQDRMVVQFSYKGTLADGSVFDQSADGQPVEFIYGTGTMIPGLETGLKGLKAGDKKTIAIKAAEAYGERDESLVQEIPRNQFPEGMELTVGQQLSGQTDQGVVTATVMEIRDDAIVMDFNHQLAGKDLTFDIQVVKVRRATQEELAQTQAQSQAQPQ